MNGFSVCNKLKRDPALKDVPLIIMSSESSDETFEQHRKLRTRAEDYVHKPIAFGELLEHIRTLRSARQRRREVHPKNDAAIVIEDDIQVEDPDEFEATMQGAKRRNSVAIAAEVDAFADSAFDHLMEGESRIRRCIVRCEPGCAPLPRDVGPRFRYQRSPCQQHRSGPPRCHDRSDEPVVALDGLPLAATAVDEAPASSSVDVDTGALPSATLPRPTG